MALSRLIRVSPEMMMLRTASKPSFALSMGAQNVLHREILSGDGQIMLYPVYDGHSGHLREFYNLEYESHSASWCISHATLSLEIENDGGEITDRESN